MEATAPGVDAELCSNGVLVNWRFGARGSRGPLSVHWYDGGLRPPTPAEGGCHHADWLQACRGGRAACSEVPA